MNHLCKTYKLIISVLLVCCIGLKSHAQDKVMVLTKTISRDIKYTGQQLHVAGEKSNIHIQGWKENYIQLQIKLISKNPDADIAKDDLQIIKYQLKEGTSDIFIKNYFENAEYKKVTSNLSAIINIKIPFTCNVSIENLYGNVDISQTKSHISVSNSFGEVTVKNCSNSLSQNLFYSNIKGTNLNGVFTITSEKSDINLNDISGRFSIQSSYGEINIDKIKSLESLDINATRSKVDIQLLDIQNFNFELSTKSSVLNLPVSLQSKVIKEKPHVKLLHKNGSKSLIKIKTTYCPININQF